MDPVTHITSQRPDLCLVGAGQHENDRLSCRIYDQRTGWLSIFGSHHIDPDSLNTHTLIHTHTRAARDQLLARHGLRRQITLSNLLISAAREGKGKISVHSNNFNHSYYDID